MFLLTFCDLQHSFGVNGTDLPELRVLGVRVKGKLSNLFNVGPLGIDWSRDLGRFWRGKHEKM